jgi:hypothetical protein
MTFEKIIESVIALFIIIVFLTTILPELGRATGSNIAFAGIALVILAIGVFVSILKAI